MRRLTRGRKRVTHPGAGKVRAAAVRADRVYGCWHWGGELDADGYGRIGPARAHRVLWQLATGADLGDQELDHVCRRRDCVRPSHLEAVTRSENELRKRWRVRVRRKHCAAGHSLFVHGRRTPEGGIVCRRCDAELEARDRQALAALQVW